MMVLRWVLCTVGVLAGILEVCAADQVVLELRYPEGRTVRYQNRYRLEYFSDKAEFILGEGTLGVQSYGEWRSRERVSEGGDSVKITARVDKAGSQVTLLGRRLTYEQFPYTLNMLNNLSFAWQITPEGRATGFGPDFPAFKIERQDMITDLRQIWMPGLAPVLPDLAVTVGYTWEGEQRIEEPFYSFSAGVEPSLMQFTSTYKVKKIRKKKGHRVVEIEEERKIRYRGWLHFEVVSLMIDGTGKGYGNWEIDTDLQLVLSHNMETSVERPQVRLAGDPKPIVDIKAKVELIFSRKLDKLEKE
jgi:hypothetical protein